MLATPPATFAEQLEQPLTSTIMLAILLVTLAEQREPLITSIQTLATRAAMFAVQQEAFLITCTIMTAIPRVIPADIQDLQPIGTTMHVTLLATLAAQLEA